VIVAMPVVGMMQAAADEIIHVVSMGDGGMAAIGTMDMFGRVALGAMGAVVGMGLVHFDDVFVDMIAVDVMEVTVLEVIRVAIVTDADVAAAGAVLVALGLLGLGFLFGAFAHR
jgi:hypothetical protein